MSSSRRSKSSQLPPGLLDLHAIRRERAERSLSQFIRQGWRYADPSEYVHGWHIDAICEHLEAVNTGEIRRLLINVPPRHMKSLAVAVHWPAWTWIRRAPSALGGAQTRFLFASYAQSLSVRDSVKCRRVIESGWYRANWSDRFRLTSDQNTKTRFDNDRGGYRLATSVDGSTTGEGGDIIVVDDPHNVREAESDTQRQAVLTWWDEAMSSRLNDPKTGAYVVIMQRLNERDLAGHILAADHGYEHLCLPARFESDHPHVWGGDRREHDGELLWPERFGQQEIGALEAAMGSYAAAGQLQQRPAPRTGGMFERQWFQIVREAPADARRARYWDFAATEAKVNTDPDWTAGIRIALKDGIYYIEDAQRIRGTPQQVESLVRQTANSDGIGISIWIEQEPGSAGKSVVDHYQRSVLPGYAVRGNRETGAKEQRAEPMSAAAEAGNIRLVRGAWNDAFLDEISVFPMGAHDDQVDAASGAFRMLAALQEARVVKVTGA